MRHAQLSMSGNGNLSSSNEAYHSPFVSMSPIFVKIALIASMSLPRVFVSSKRGCVHHSRLISRKSAMKKVNQGAFKTGRKLLLA